MPPDHTNDRHRFRVIRETEEFLALAPMWNELLVTTRADSIFSTWEYVSTWWEVYGRDHRLAVITATDDAGRLVGLAPLIVGRGDGKRRHLRYLTFLGGLGDSLAEYQDFIVAPGLEDELVPEFWKIANREIAGWDVARFPLVSADSPTVALLTEARADGVPLLAVARRSIAPYIRLDGSWDEYFDLPKSRNVRRNWRRLHRDFDVTVLRGGIDIDVADALERLIALNHERFGDRNVSFGTDEFMTFHRRLVPRLAARGWVTLLVMQLGEDDAAAQYDFAYGRAVSLFQGGWSSSYQRHAPGKVLMGYAVRSAYERGMSEFDFLSGDEPYKHDWGTDVRELVDLSVDHPTSRRARAFRTAERARSVVLGVRAAVQRGLGAANAAVARRRGPNAGEDGTAS